MGAMQCRSLREEATSREWAGVTRPRRRAGPLPSSRHHLAHHALGHAALEQGLGEVGEFADGADAQRLTILPKVGQAPGVALIGGQPLEGRGRGPG